MDHEAIEKLLIQAMSEADPKRTMRVIIKMVKESRKARDEERFKRLKEETKERVYCAALYYAKGETFLGLEGRFGESFVRELRKPKGYKVLFQYMVKHHVLSLARDDVEQSPRYSKMFPTLYPHPPNALVLLLEGVEPFPDG